MSYDCYYICFTVKLFEVFYCLWVAVCSSGSSKSWPQAAAEPTQLGMRP